MHAVHRLPCALTNTHTPLNWDDKVLITQRPRAHLLRAQQLAALSSAKLLQLRDSLCCQAVRAPQRHLLHALLGHEPE